VANEVTPGVGDLRRHTLDELGDVVNQGEGTKIIASTLEGNELFDLADLGDVTDFDGSYAERVTDDPYDPFPMELPAVPPFGGLPGSGQSGNPEPFPLGEDGADPHLPGNGFGVVFVSRRSAAPRTFERRAGSPRRARRGRSHDVFGDCAAHRVSTSPL